MPLLLILLLVFAPLLILLVAFREPARRWYPYRFRRGRRRWPLMGR